MPQIQIDQESLLDTLYATATNETGWDAFLRELITVTGSRSARMLILNSEADEVLHSIKVNIDDNDHQNYVDYYVNKCPWRLELSQKPTGRLYSTYYDFSCHQPQFYQTEFYNDWARDLDIHHGVCGTAFSSGDNKVQLLIQRTAGQGHYTPDDTARINSLMPHVRQALRFGLVLQEQRQSLVMARMAAETHCPPFILFDCTGHVSHISSGCERLLHDGALAITGKQVRLGEHGVQQRFQKALKNAVASARGNSPSETLLRVQRQGKSPLRCLLAATYPGAPYQEFWPTPAFAALYIYDPEQVVRVDQTLLMQLYQLTDSEARIAVDIAKGLDTVAIARRHQRSPHTVRSQLKSVFTKTRCRRQSQLAALVLQSPAARYY